MFEFFLQLSFVVRKYKKAKAYEKAAIGLTGGDREAMMLRYHNEMHSFYFGLGNLLNTNAWAEERAYHAYKVKFFCGELSRRIAACQASK